MTQCVISPPGRDSAAGWLRPLTVATVTTLRKDPVGCARLAVANRYHPAKGSFARFPSGASLNATMQFTLLPTELGQNLSFSGADCDIHHSTVSMVSFFDRSGASLNATMQFTLLPSELGQNLSFSGADCDIHRYTVSRFSFLDLSGASLNATMQFTLLPSELGQNLSFSGADCDIQRSTVCKVRHEFGHGVNPKA